MKKITDKLRSRAGESLIESLAAILIFTLASIVLFSMVTSAGDINSQAKAKDIENQEQMVAVEKGIYCTCTSDCKTAENTCVADCKCNPENCYGTTLTEGSVGFKLIDNNNPGASKSLGTVEVEIYGGEEDELYAYYIDVTEPAGG